jgi:hypothetical protein
MDDLQHKLTVAQFNYYIARSAYFDATNAIHLKQALINGYYTFIELQDASIKLKKWLDNQTNV